MVFILLAERKPRARALADWMRLLIPSKSSLVSLSAEIMPIDDRMPSKAATRIGRGEGWAAPLFGQTAPRSGGRTRGSGSGTDEWRDLRFQEVCRRSSVSGNPSVVLVMEPAEDWPSNNVLGGTRCTGGDQRAPIGGCMQRPRWGRP